MTVRFVGSVIILLSLIVHLIVWFGLDLSLSPRKIEMADGEEIFFDITLNYEGVDIVCNVNAETANRLLNDSDAARQYVEEILRINALESSMTELESPTFSRPCLSKNISHEVWSSKNKKSSHQDHVMPAPSRPRLSKDMSYEVWSSKNKKSSHQDHEMAAPSRPGLSKDMSQELWSSKSSKSSHQDHEMPTPSRPGLSKDMSQELWSSKSNKSSHHQDHEATLLFLELRAKLAKQFDDKKSIKTTLWQRIASQMNDAGYWVGEGKEGAEKCRQKFQNMQRTYNNHIKSMKTTEEAKKDPPLYFTELHEILGGKDKTNPPYLEDTEEVVSIEQENTKTPEPSVATIKSRFSSAGASGQTLKPSNATTKILEHLKKQHEEDKKQRDDQFALLHASLKRQNEQRDRLLELFAATLKNKPNKRNKRSHSSSESDYQHLYIQAFR